MKNENNPITIICSKYIHFAKGRGQDILIIESYESNIEKVRGDESTKERKRVSNDKTRLVSGSFIIYNYLLVSLLCGIYKHETERRLSSKYCDHPIALRSQWV